MASSENEIPNVFRQFQISSPTNMLDNTAIKNSISNDICNQVNSTSNDSFLNSNFCQYINSINQLKTSISNEGFISTNPFPFVEEPNVNALNFDPMILQNIVTSCFLNAFKTMFNNTLFPSESYYNNNDINNVLKTNHLEQFNLNISQSKDNLLPNLDHNVAKEIILQLINQLKLAGELETDNFSEILQKILQDSQMNSSIHSKQRHNCSDNYSNSKSSVLNNLNRDTNIYDSDNKSESNKSSEGIGKYINHILDDQEIFNDAKIQFPIKNKKCKRKSEVEKLMPKDNGFLEYDFANKRLKNVPESSSLSLVNKDEFVWPTTKLKPIKTDWDSITRYDIKKCRVSLERIDLKELKVENDFSVELTLSKENSYKNKTLNLSDHIVNKKFKLAKDHSEKSILNSKNDYNHSSRMSTINVNSNQSINDDYIKQQSKFLNNYIVSETNKSTYNSIKDKNLICLFNSIDEMKFLTNMNELNDSSFMMMYLRRPIDDIEWLAMNIVTQGGRKLNQCSFCPQLDENIFQLTDHIRAKHSDLTFALVSMESPKKSESILIVCRHCDFATIDKIIMSIHFEIYHGIAGFINNSTPTNVEIPSNFVFNSLNPSTKVYSLKCYLCNDCGLLSANIINMSFHIQKEHVNKGNFNGYFTKMKAIDEHFSTETEVKDYIESGKYLEKSLDAFFCIICQTIMFCPFEALSHNLLNHISKKILLCCIFNCCKYTSFDEIDIKNHLVNKHKISYNIYCSAAMIDKNSDAKYFECEPLCNRKMAMIEPKNVNRQIQSLTTTPMPANSQINKKRHDGVMDLQAVIIDPSTIILQPNDSSITPIEIVPSEMPIEISKVEDKPNIKKLDSIVKSEALFMQL